MREEYKGSWERDQMCGWGVYKYISGAIYSGEWSENQHNGKGIYEFPDGCIYEGEWKNHKMHGEGCFTDKNGRKWEGEFVEGVYQSKMQKRLKMEKIISQKKNEVKKNSSTFFTNFIEVSVFWSNKKRLMKQVIKKQ